MPQCLYAPRLPPMSGVLAVLLDGSGLWLMAANTKQNNLTAPSLYSLVSYVMNVATLPGTVPRLDIETPQTPLSSAPDRQPPVFVSPSQHRPVQKAPQQYSTSTPSSPRSQPKPPNSSQAEKKQPSRKRKHAVNKTHTHTHRFAKKKYQRTEQRHGGCMCVQGAWDAR